MCGFSNAYNFDTDYRETGTVIPFPATAPSVPAVRVVKLDAAGNPIRPNPAPTPDVVVTRIVTRDGDTVYVLRAADAEGAGAWARSLGKGKVQFGFYLSSHESVILDALRDSEDVSEFAFNAYFSERSFWAIWQMHRLALGREVETDGPYAVAVRPDGWWEESSDPVADEPADDGPTLYEQPASLGTWLMVKDPNPNVPVVYVRRAVVTRRVEVGVSDATRRPGTGSYAFLTEDQAYALLVALARVTGYTIEPKQE